MDAQDLSAILVGILIADNSAADAQASLKVLDKIVANAQKPDDKFRHLPGTNETVKLRVRQTAGALEFLDAVGFSAAANGDITLANPNPAALAAASEAIALASAQLASMAPATPARPAAGVASAADWQAQAHAEADARAKEIARRAEEDRKKKDLLKKQIAAEQREAKDRPVRTSVATSMARPAAPAGGGGGKPRYVDSLAEYQKLVGGAQPVVVNYTATWCGPCQAIAPMVEAEAAKHPNVVFAKVDIECAPFLLCSARRLTRAPLRQRKPGNGQRQWHSSRPNVCALQEWPQGGGGQGRAGRRRARALCQGRRALSSFPINHMCVFFSCRASTAFARPAAPRG